jgi:hypothetical protein
MKKLEVGQKLWFVPSERRYRDGDCEVTVVKIGRKWATLDRDWFGNQLRIDLEHWYADGRGYSSPGRCYESQDQYGVIKLRDDAWSRFRQVVARTYSVECDFHAICRAATELGLDFQNSND